MFDNSFQSFSDHLKCNLHYHNEPLKSIEEISDRIILGILVLLAWQLSKHNSTQ